MKKNLYTLFFAFALVAFFSHAKAQVTVTYNIDMTGATLGAAGGTCATPPFDPSTDVVQAMGQEYNAWTEAENVACGAPYTPDASIDFAPVSAGSMIYTKTKDITPDGVGMTTWKYRINHSWDNDELRGVGDGNRHASLPAGAAAVIISSVFNDSANTVVVAGIDNPVLAQIKSIYPNPASSTTNLTYAVLNGGQVNIDITNAIGQVVKNVVNGQQPFGIHDVNINVADLTTGIYFVTIRIGNSSVTQKMSVVN